MATVTCFTLSFNFILGCVYNICLWYQFAFYAFHRRSRTFCQANEQIFIQQNKYCWRGIRHSINLFTCGYMNEHTTHCTAHECLNISQICLNFRFFFFFFPRCAFTVHILQRVVIERCLQKLIFYTLSIWFDQ